MRTFYRYVSIVSVIVLCGHGVSRAQSGACCLGDGTCISTDQLGCDSVVGDYVGDGTLCDVAGCVAACCFSDNTCSLETRDNCEALTGTYQGPGSTCELNCAAVLPPIFTYQGQLKALGRPVDGLIDIQLSLWTTARGGDQLGTTLTLFDTAINNGLFSVPVNFPAALFDGDNRFLEVAVRSPAWDGVGVEPVYTTLSPRQLVTYAPQSLQTRGLYVDDAGQIAVGHRVPAELLDLKGANNPTIKIQATDTSEKAGRLSLRSSNDHGMDMYYDTSGTPRMTFETVFSGVPTTKVMTINRSLSGTQDRVEVSGRIRLRSFDFDAPGSGTNLVIGHVLAVAPSYSPVNMMIDYTKSGSLESSARIEFSGNADPNVHWADLRFHTRSVSDGNVMERMRITGGGRVGIGTTSPSVSLDVVGEIRSSGASGGRVTVVDPTNQAANVSLSWLNDVARLRVGGSGPAAQGGLDIQTQGDKSLMRLLHNGNVGIGTTSPQSLLQVGVGDESSIRLGLNPQLVFSRDVANQKFRIQITGSGFSGKVLQLGRDDGVHDILLSGDVKVKSDIRTVNASGATRVRMGISTFQNPSNRDDDGEIEVFDAAGRKMVQVGPSPLISGEVSGRIKLNGPNSGNVLVGSSAVDNDLGLVSIYGRSGGSRAAMFVTSSDNGEITVRDNAGQTRAGIRVNIFGQGEVFGDVKSFCVANPKDASTDIWYASLEGPEAGAYYRGTATLRNGRATITLPDHFSDVCSHTSLTVHLTPKSAASKGLAFMGMQNGQVIVEELMGGKGTYEFDYLLIDVRSGHEGFQVIRPTLRDSASIAASAGSVPPASVNSAAVKPAVSQASARKRTEAPGRPVATPPSSPDRTPIDAASLLARIERLESLLARQQSRKGGGAR